MAVKWGTLDDDYIVGGSSDDGIYGKLGNDQLIGGAGNDSLYGGADSDTVYGEYGNDYQGGGFGGDFLFGGSGNDTLEGNEGNDLLQGGGGGDSLFGGAGADTLYSSAGNDQLFGGSGADLFDISDRGIGYHKIIGDFRLSQGDSIGGLGAELIDRLDTNHDGYLSKLDGGDVSVLLAPPSDRSIAIEFDDGGSLRVLGVVALDIDNLF